MYSHRWGASLSKQKWVAGMPAAYTAVDRSPGLQKREEGGEPKKGGSAPHREKESLAWPFWLLFFSFFVLSGIPPLCNRTSREKLSSQLLLPFLFRECRRP